MHHISKNIRIYVKYKYYEWYELFLKPYDRKYNENHSYKSYPKYLTQSKLTTHLLAKHIHIFCSWGFKVFQGTMGSCKK